MKHLKYKHRVIDMTAHTAPDAITALAEAKRHIELYGITGINLEYKHFLFYVHRRSNLLKLAAEYRYSVELRKMSNHNIK